MQHKNKIGYWKKGRGRSGEFVALSNFAIKLLKLVSAPPQLAKEADFVVEVTQERVKRGGRERGLFRVRISEFIRPLVICAAEQMNL